MNPVHYRGCHWDVSNNTRQLNGRINFIIFIQQWNAFFIDNSNCWSWNEMRIRKGYSKKWKERRIIAAAVKFHTDPSVERFLQADSDGFIDLMSFASFIAVESWGLRVEIKLYGWRWNSVCVTLGICLAQLSTFNPHGVIQENEGRMKKFLFMFFFFAVERCRTDERKWWSKEEMRRKKKTKMLSCPCQLKFFLILTNSDELFIFVLNANYFTPVRAFRAFKVKLNQRDDDDDGCRKKMWRANKRYIQVESHVRQRRKFERQSFSTHCAKRKFSSKLSSWF